MWAFSSFVQNFLFIYLSHKSQCQLTENFFNVEINKKKKQNCWGLHNAVYIVIVYLFPTGARKKVNNIFKYSSQQFKQNNKIIFHLIFQW